MKKKYFILVAFLFVGLLFNFMYFSNFSYSLFKRENSNYSFTVAMISFDTNNDNEKQASTTGLRLMANVKSYKRKIVELTLNGIDVEKMCISLNTSKCKNYIDFSEKYTLDLTGEEDGEKTIYVSYKDKNGNIVASLKENIILDTQAPKTNRIQIGDGEGLVRELALNSVGADYMCFSNTSDQANECQEWVEYQKTYSWRLEEEGEKKTVYAFFKDEAGNVSKVVSDTVVLKSSCLSKEESYSLEYTGSVISSSELDVQFCKGTYRLELWGAQGGNAGGLGGYTAGDITLTGEEKLYFYVGGAGSKGSAGFNGGGSAGDMAGGGGGATDIRINEDSLYARVIVAGGGGGTGRDSCAKGAVGGGTDAAGGQEQNSCGIQGGGGTQFAGGVVGSYKNTLGANAGTFGLGGNALDASFDGGAGGGGWYGGGAGASSSWSSGGGGGSSFAYAVETSTQVPDEYLLSASYYLTNISILKGNDEQVPSSNAILGNGYIKVTRLN